MFADVPRTPFLGLVYLGDALIDANLVRIDNLCAGHTAGTAQAAMVPWRATSDEWLNRNLARIAQELARQGVTLPVTPSVQGSYRTSTGLLYGSNTDQNYNWQLFDAALLQLGIPQGPL